MPRRKRSATSGGVMRSLRPQTRRVGARSPPSRVSTLSRRAARAKRRMRSAEADVLTSRRTDSTQSGVTSAGSWNTSSIFSRTKAAPGRCGTPRAKLRSNRPEEPVRMSPVTRSGTARATRRATWPPSELPPRTRRGISRASRKPRTWSARASMVASASHGSKTGRAKAIGRQAGPPRCSRVRSH
jgi:hypothetical protein